MEITRRKYYLISGIFFVLFCIFTYLVLTVDVQAIGPEGSFVGFATVNKAIHDYIGVNKFFYVLTEYLGKTAFLVCVGFGFVGLIQWIKRKKLLLVDGKIILLGIYYLIVIGFYVMFNKLAINYRPVFEADGSLEASFPSSHTVLAICVFATAFLQDIFNPNDAPKLNKANHFWSVFLPVLMLVGRLLSGVHWFTDIVGAYFLSIALICLYLGSIQQLKDLQQMGNNTSRRKKQ